MKKFISLFLSLVITITMFTPVSADTESELIEEEKKKVVEEQVPELPAGYDQAVIDDINNNPIESGSQENNSSEVSTLNYSTYSTRGATLPEEFKIVPVNEPFNIYNSDNESVSMATGALNYEINLLHLPGRNGLDVDINIRYNSSDAVITSNEYDYHETNKRTNFNNFAIGWSFGFTAIVKNVSLYGYRKDTHIMFADGSSYSIIDKADNATTDQILTIENFGLQDYKLEWKAVNNQYVLTYPDGIKEYFDGTYGNITKKEDRFGNYIIFEYEDTDYFKASFVDYIFNPSIYSLTRHHLSKIVDSAGNEIEFIYYNDSAVKEKRIGSFSILLEDKKIAGVNLNTQKTYNGKVDVVSSVSVGDLITKFKYEENIGHICYKADEVQYAVNSSLMALTKITYPTGGVAEYSYDKHRSAYETYGYDPETSWYEVYKVSSRFDSNKDLITYEYEGDRTGYPYSGLTYDTEYIADEEVQYHTIVQHNEQETIYTFDYRHNLIKENRYDVNTAQSSYMNSRGETKWNAIIDNQLYRVGIINNELYIYTQNFEFHDAYFKEPEFLKPCRIDEDTIIKNVKTHNYCVYVFYTKPAPNENKVLGVKYYDVRAKKWSAGEEYIVPSDVGSLDLSVLYYNGQEFYTYYYNIKNDDMYYFICSQRGNWYLETCDMRTYNTTIYKHIGSNKGKIYFWANAYIIEYDPTLGSHRAKYFLQLDNGKSFYGGFILEDNTYICLEDGIYHLDIETGALQTYKYPFNFNNNNIIRKTANNKIYIFSKNKDGTGKTPVYMFNPKDSEPWSIAAYRMFNSTDYDVVMGLSGAYITVGKATNPYYSSMLTQYYGGFEVLNLFEGTNSVVDYTYNSYKQLTTKENGVYRGSIRKSLGTEQYSYLDKKSAVTSYTDNLGNNTQYSYTDSTYYIPTTIKNYAGTENEIVTTNTLSDDKTKIITAETAYDNSTIHTDYLYGESYCGNVIGETTYNIINGQEVELYTKEYEYDNTDTFRVVVTDKGILSYDDNLIVGGTYDVYKCYTYDVFGNVLTESDGNGNVTHHNYDMNNRLIKTTYPDSSYIEYSYVLSPDNSRMETSYNGQYKTIDYYDGIGKIKKQSEVNDKGKEIDIYTYEYDRGFLNRKYDLNGNFVQYGYDFYNRLDDIIHCDTDETYLTRQWLNYDDFELTQTYQGESSPIVVRYFDIAGRLIKEEFETEAGTNTTTYEYDYASRLIKTTDSKGNSVINEYNDKGQLLSVTNALGQKTLYEYDSWGNVSKVTYSGGNTVSYRYDRLGRLQESTDALGQKQYYAYDNNNNLTTHKDRKGQVVNMSYDSMNRLVNKNAGTTNISYTYNAFGSPLTMTDSTGTTSYAYTYNNMLSQITSPDGKSISYAYDLLGNVIGVNDYADNNISYTYDGAYRIDTISNNGSLMADYEYADYYNRISSITYPEGTVSYNYDKAYNVSSVTNKLADGKMLNKHTYAYDILGNVVEEQCSEPYTQQTVYTYDALNRLTSVTEDNGTVTSYTFDAGNNIMTKNIAHSSTLDQFKFKQDGVTHYLKEITAHNVTYSYNVANQLMAETESVLGTSDTYSGFVEKVNLYTYDANGNMIRKETGGQVDERVVEYTYNELNQLTGYKQPNDHPRTYVYDGTGMRVSSSDGYTIERYYWDRGYVANETYQGNISATNYIGAQGIFARTYEGETNYLFKNAHGDVTNTAENGVKGYSYEYDAYGKEEYQYGISSNPVRYCGEYVDSESGLIYLRNRYYDPSIGRFITEDPAMDGLNWYAYCGNNPVNFIDPSGLIIELSDDATYEQKQEYERAIKYLKNSETAQKLIEKLQKSNVLFTVMFVDSLKSTYEYATNNIMWNNREGLVVLGSEEVQSPALSLAHEMGHAAQHLDGELNKYIQSKLDADKVVVEQSNLTKYEINIAKELDEPVRTSYYSQLGKRVMNNSIHYITKIYSGWLGFKKYEVHHNKYPIIGTSLGCTR